MKQIVLEYDTVLTASTLTYSITANALDVRCEVVPETVSEFTTTDHSNFQYTIGRYSVFVNLTTNNWANDEQVFVNVGKFINAPLRRMHIIPTSSITSINGYTEFNSTNTINFNVSDASVTWGGNKTYRNYSFTLVSEDKYSIT